MLGQHVPVTSQRGALRNYERYNCVKIIRQAHSSAAQESALPFWTIITSSTSKCGAQSLLTGLNGVGNGWRISWNFYHQAINYWSVYTSLRLVCPWKHDGNMRQETSWKFRTPQKCLKFQKSFLPRWQLKLNSQLPDLKANLTIKENHTFVNFKCNEESSQSTSEIF